MGWDWGPRLPDAGIWRDISLISLCDDRITELHVVQRHENGRVFPVRRYLSANGECRFEVYNCADLIGIGIENAGKLLDLTLVKDISQASQALTEAKQKEIFCNYTSGHSKRGVL